MRRDLRTMAIVLCASALAALQARADERAELEALRAEVSQERAALAQERAALAEQRQRVDDALGRLEALAPQPAAVGDAAKSSGAELHVYGFVQADGIYDFNRVDPDWSATLRPSKIPVQCPGSAACGNDGETTLSVRQTRFGVRGLVPTSVGDLTTRFEFDLFGVGADAGQTTFRLRHAYGQLGDFLAGQTWSLFMDPDVFPNTIDYWGPPGMVFLRNPQIRWTPVHQEQLSFAVALESPGSAVDQGKADTTDLSSWNHYPDVTAQLRWNGDWGHVQFATLFRWVGYQVRSLDGGGPDGYQLGAAANVSGVFNVFGGDRILWQVAGGQGFANYMNDGGVDLAPNESLTHELAVSGLGWLLYYDRQWDERWTSSIGFSEHRQWNTGGQTDAALRLVRYASANVLFHPTSDMFVGPELIWGDRQDKDSHSADDLRMQVSFHYDFGATIHGRR